MPLPPPETLSDLFASSATYWVPPYQRAYSWGEDHVRQFLQDVQDHKAGKPYYLGHFLFERKSGRVPDAPDTTAGEEDEVELFVIDGQQRLTTVVLFMGCVCRVLKGRGLAAEAESEALERTFLERDHAFRFHTVGADQDVFKDLVQKGRCNLDPDQMSRSQRRMHAACAWLWKELQAAQPGDLRAWTEGVAGAHVSQKTVVDKVQATQIFTLQNSRGKDLTELEKLKAWLMHQVYLNSETKRENEDIASVEEQFKTIYQTAELLKHLQEDQVLRHHDTAFHPRAGGTAMVHLVEDLRGREGRVVVGHILEFCKALAATFRHVQSLEALMQEHEAVADLVILEAADSWPLLIKLHAMHGSDLVRSPMLLKLLRDAEVTLMKFRFVHGRSSNDLPGYAKKLGVVPGHDVPGLARTLEWSSSQGFRGNHAFDHAFVAYLNCLNHYNYDRDITRYILWKYENKLRVGSDVSLTPKEYLNTKGDARMKLTLEHLAPVTPRDKQEVYPREFVEQCLHNIGNLVLMGHGMNSSQSNHAMEVKAVVMSNTTHASHRRVAEVLGLPCGEKGCLKDWCDHKIRERHDALVAFARQRWRVSPPAASGSAEVGPAETEQPPADTHAAAEPSVSAN